jgi:hypothetical protein
MIWGLIRGPIVKGRDESVVDGFMNDVPIKPMLFLDSCIEAIS